MKKILDFDMKALCSEASEIIVNTVDADIREIAVIGIAVKMPMAEDIREFWNNIKNGADCIRQLPQGRKADADAFLRFMNYESEDYAEIAYLEEIDKFDCNFFGISPKEASLMDPNQKLFLETAWKAIEDAGYGGGRLIGSRTGVYVGYGGTSQYKSIVDRLEPSYSAMAAPGNEAPIIASRIAYLLDFKGPSMLVNTSCSSSLVAIHLACQGIKSGECTLAIAGGIKLHLLNLKQRHDIGIMSSDGRTRTFDQQSDGTGNGEGVAAVLLKPLQKALEDGDGIYAVIKGSAVNQDGATNGITSPNPEAQEDVLARAWENAGIDPKTVTYIEAHGTGTKLGDPIEIEGITRAFRKYTDRKQFCAVGSVKSNIGHLDNTAGIAGFIKAVLALQHGELPPTLHFNTPNRRIDFDDSSVYVNDKLQKWDTEGFTRKCGVSSFGLSGTNCHIILEEAPGTIQTRTPEESGTEVLALSAKSRNALQTLTVRYCEFIGANSGCNWKDICYTANTGRWHHPYRLAVIAGGKEDLAEKLGKLSDSWEEGLLEPGIFYGEKKAAVPFLSAGTRNDATDGKITSGNASTVYSIRKLISDGKKDRGVLKEICGQYAKGEEIDWNELYSGESRKRVHLPSYPFERIRCVIAAPERLEQKPAGPDRDMFFAPSWKYEPLGSYEPVLSPGPVLVFMDGKGMGGRISLKMKEEGTEIIEVAWGKEYCRIDANKYEIGTDPADFEILLLELRGRNIKRMLHLMSITEGRKPPESAEQLEQALDNGAISLLSLVKAISRTVSGNPVDLVCISEYAAAVTGREIWIYPENASLFALGKAVFLENPDIRCRCIDIDAYTDITSILEEIKTGYKEYMVAYRRDERFVEELERCNIDCIPDSRTEIKQNGVYLVTGGTGRLGLEICKYLAKDRQVRIVMINRSALAERNRWDDIMNGPDTRAASIIRTIREIEGNGTEVACYSADVANEDELSPVLENVRERYGKIDGVIHCAAVGVGKEGKRIVRESEKSLKQGLAPKVQGTWLLNSLTRTDEPDFFILFSSAITVTGGIGAAAYIAANAYLDAFAAWRDKAGARVQAINWPMWKDESDPAWAIREGNQMFEAIRPAEAIRIFDKLLRKRTARILPGNWNFKSEIYKLEKYMPFRISDTLKEEILLYEKSRDMGREGQKPAAKPAVKPAGRRNGIYSETEKKLVSIYGNVLGLNEINITDSFTELGGNSIIAIRIETDLESQGIPMGITDIYRYGTVEKLAVHLENPCNDRETERNEKQNTTAVGVPESDPPKMPEAGERKSVDSTGCMIADIEPFNDFFYKSCYYNSLFPVIRHFGREIRAFPANDVIAYEYARRPYEVTFKTGYLPIRPDEHILSGMGIILQSRIYASDVIGDIRRAISRERPVILWVDCFYEPIRYDTFQKIHLQHTWLVYGYNECDCTCCILEHKNRDSLTYSKRVIGWQDLIRCYDGFNENFNQSGHIDSYMEYYCPLSGRTDITAAAAMEKTERDHFVESMFRYRAVVLEGLKQLERFAEDIPNTDIRRPEWRENITQLFESLNHIVNVKRVEAWRSSVFFKERGDILSLSAEIVENWEFIRTQIGKFVFTWVLPEELPEILSEKLKRICHAEYEMNEAFFKTKTDDGT